MKCENETGTTDSTDMQTGLTSIREMRLRFEIFFLLELEVLIYISIQ